MNSPKNYMVHTWKYNKYNTIHASLIYFVLIIAIDFDCLRMFPEIRDERLSLFGRYFAGLWVHFKFLVGPWRVNCLLLRDLELISFILLLLLLVLFLGFLEHVIVEAEFSHVLLFLDELVQTLQSLVELTLGSGPEMEVKPEHWLGSNLITNNIHVLEPVLVGRLSQESIRVDRK